LDSFLPDRGDAVLKILREKVRNDAAISPSKLGHAIVRYEDGQAHADEQIKNDHIKKAFRDRRQRSQSSVAAVRRSRKTSGSSEHGERSENSPPLQRSDFSTMDMCFYSTPASAKPAPKTSENLNLTTRGPGAATSVVNGDSMLQESGPSALALSEPKGTTDMDLDMDIEESAPNSDGFFFAKNKSAPAPSELPDSASKLHESTLRKDGSHNASAPSLGNLGFQSNGPLSLGTSLGTAFNDCHTATNEMSRRGAAASLLTSESRDSSPLKTQPERFNILVKAAEPVGTGGRLSCNDSEMMLRLHPTSSMSASSTSLNTSFSSSSNSSGSGPGFTPPTTHGVPASHFRTVDGNASYRPFGS